MVSTPARGFFFTRITPATDQVHFLVSMDVDQVQLNYVMLSQIAVDATGDIYGVGYYPGTLTAGGAGYPAQGPNDAFVVKLDGDSGSVLWLTQITGGSWMYGSGVTIDPSGDMYVAGHHVNTFDCAGVTLPAQGENTVYLARVNPTTGACINAVHTGNAGHNYAYDLVAASDDRLYLSAGSTSLTHDTGSCAFDQVGGYVMALSPTFQQEGVACFGQTTTVMQLGLMSATADHLAFAAFYQGGPLQFPGGEAFPASTGMNGAHALFDTNLMHLDSRAYTPAGGDARQTDVTHDSSGNVVMIGNTTAPELCW